MSGELETSWGAISPVADSADPMDGGGVPAGGRTRAEATHAQSEPWAIVLAGGAGTRLRAFVRQILGSQAPKQFCRVVGTRSMLRHTWDRAARLVAPERIVTVITAGQERYLAEEVRAGIPGTVLVQPENKETAPGLLLPLLWIARRAPGAPVAVLPADHFVWAEGRFVDAVRAALAAASAHPDRLTLLGVEPEGPETGYGWIAPGVPVPSAPREIFAVRRFWEKPDRATAARLMTAGALWNTLILAARLEAYLGLAAAGVPHVLGALEAVVPHLGTPAEGTALRAAYRRLLPTNFSRSVLARAPEALLVLATRGLGWSDWGDPERIVRTLHRYARQPTWMPAYARAQARAAAGA